MRGDVDKRAAGDWSISDVVGHVADWEQRMLKAMYHIHDPSLPIVPAVSDDSLDWNGILAVRRANKSWAENYHYLRETQIETNNFIATLKPGGAARFCHRTTGPPAADAA